MHTTRFSSSGGGGSAAHPTPVGRPPPPDAEPPSIAGHVTCDHAGKPLPVNRMTDTCKTSTLPQISFVGGKKMAAKGSRIDFMFLGPATRPLDTLLLVQIVASYLSEISFQPYVVNFCLFCSIITRKEN